MPRKASVLEEFRAILCGTMFAVLLFTAVAILAQAGSVLSNAQSPPGTERPGESTKLSSATIAELKDKANLNDPEAELKLGRAYEDGDGVPQNYALAVKWYRASGDQGNSTAQDNLGTMYRTGLGVERSQDEALRWYRKATRQKNPNAMFNVGTAYYNGDGVPTSDATAYAWFLLAKEAGNNNATDAVRRAETELKPWIINEGFKTIANLYAKGNELPQNSAESLKWLRKAAQNGDIDAEVLMATTLMNGKGVPQDFVEGRSWCERLVKQGNNVGMCCMGQIYNKGLGTQPDVKKAAKFFDLAAKDGNHPAAMELAKIYATGATGKVDRHAAFMLYVGIIKDQEALNEAAKLRSQMTIEEWHKVLGELPSYRIDGKKLDALLQKMMSQ